MTERGPSAAKPELIDSEGLGPFTTRRVYRRADGSPVVWKSRRHRKRLPERKPGEEASRGTLLLLSLWMPWHLSWWIGAVFAVGSSLFALGSALSLDPELARAWGFDSAAINETFFIGSIPFTTAAYLQLFQAANAGDPSHPDEHSSGRPVWFGWYPHRIGWLSCALQFVGTLLFNLNTWDAMQPDMGWFQLDLKVWAPDLAGSMLFLASGYLAFAETCHGYWAWNPKSISWWVTFINLMGCVAFMFSAELAFVPPHAAGPALSSVTFTLIGAICFWVGSLLMLPETAFPR